MNRLWIRLSVAFLWVTGLALGSVALIVRSTTESSFRQYVNRRDTSSFDQELVLALQAYYAAQGSWQGAETLLPGPKETAGSGAGHGPGNGRGGSKALVADSAGLVVASNDPALIGTQLDETLRRAAVELMVDGERVGWLAQQTPGTQVLGEAEKDFLTEITNRLVVVAVGAALAAVVTGAVLAWQLTRRLRRLTHAALKLAGGSLGLQVTHAGGSSEERDLTQAFNTLSRALAQGEQLRRRMAADIAHELRTPVSVLRGHLEAMLDGVFALDAEHLAVAYDQTLHLARLVDDLRLLTQAEAKQLPLERLPVVPGELVQQAARRFAPLALDAGIALEIDIAPDLPLVEVDMDRMQQVWGNLLSNALRHTPPGGRIVIRAASRAGAVCFSVQNSGDSLTTEEAANVFQPFWRAEQARERDRGGSGLGLAITQQLIALHGGRIWVESAANQTTFVFVLPPITLPA